MNPGPIRAFAATFLAAVCAMPGDAPGQDRSPAGIQRCVAPDGGAIYTDKTCAAFGATAKPMSDELLTRLAHAGEGGVDTGIFGGRRAPEVARRSAASGCARSSTQLSMDLQGAWVLGDVNRVAESYHWAGLDSGQARTIMQRLERLVDQPLWQAHYFDAHIGDGMVQVADASAEASTGAGVMQLVFEDGASPRVQDFDVRRYRGCYFVQF